MSSFKNTNYDLKIFLILDEKFHHVFETRSGVLLRISINLVTRPILTLIKYGFTHVTSIILHKPISVI